MAVPEEIVKSEVELELSATCVSAFTKSKTPPFTKTFPENNTCKLPAVSGGTTSKSVVKSPALTVKSPLK